MKIIQLIKKIPLKSSKVLKNFGTLPCIIRPYEHYDSVVFNQYFYIFLLVLDHVGKILQLYVGLSSFK